MSPEMICLDSGSFQLRVGMVGQDLPSATFYNFLGREPSRRSDGLIDPQSVHFGEELTSSACPQCALVYPTHKSCVMDWGLQRRLWESAFAHLKWRPEQNIPLLYADPMLLPNDQQEGIQQLVFEEMNFPHLCRVPASVLAFQQHVHLLAGIPPAASAACVMVDAGHDATTITPMFNGIPLNYAVRRYDVGGEAITSQLATLLGPLAPPNWLKTNLLKERLCHCALDYPAEIGRMPMPSTAVLSMERAVLTAPEVLFCPRNVGVSSGGLADTLHEAVESTPGMLHPLLYRNILVHGGTANLPGFCERLASDVRALVPDGLEVVVECATGQLTNPRLAAWQGGAWWAMSYPRSTFLELWGVSRDEYMESGTHALCRRKFVWY
ncbi:putative Actin-related protein [Paratrimastix pyriformis]|uniref:Actin-related protein n=1 Tax=Paratrimastix pyriformis TaxID=342808 RepID=A0ABQ8U9M0_9EUKA|nr:putative Actin-related protein [Paratrimastix pyriformis]